MNWNFSSIGASLKSALASAGGTISASNVGAVLSSLVGSSNPNKTAELAVCASIILSAASPTLVAAYQTKLIDEDGLPPQAAALVATLGQPGVDIDNRVMQIEQIIQQS